MRHETIEGPVVAVVVLVRGDHDSKVWRHTSVEAAERRARALAELHGEECTWYPGNTFRIDARAYYTKS